MGTETESLVGKRVIIRWRLFRGKPELVRYKCFYILAVVDGWIQAQPFYELVQRINDEPPIWVPMVDIGWMAEVEKS